MLVHETRRSAYFATSWVVEFLVEGGQARVGYACHHEMGFVAAHEEKISDGEGMLGGCIAARNALDDVEDTVATTQWLTPSLAFC